MKLAWLALAVLGVACAALAVWWITSGPAGVAVRPPSELSEAAATPASVDLPGELRAEAADSRESDTPTAPSRGAPAIASAPAIAATDELLGRVVDDLGSPLQQFEIEARVLSRPDVVVPRNASPVRWKRLGTDGWFHLTSLPAGEWQITALGNGDMRSVPMYVRTPSDGHAIELVVPRGATITGSVSAASGASVADARNGSANAVRRVRQ